jgi:hypothetical protein
MKGMEGKVIWMIVAMVIAIIIALVLSLFVFKGQAWGFSSITDMVDEWFGMSSPEEKTVIKAMACSYYRCIEGCNSGLVKSAIWEDEDGNRISCLESFCKVEWRDSDGKICGDNSRAHPVEVSVGEPVTLSPGGFFKGIKPVSECTKSAGGAGYLGTDWVFVDEKLKEGFCDKSRCEMKAGEYFIWMDNGWFGSKVTILCSSS